MSNEKKPDVNATIQLDQIDNIDDVKLPESRPRIPGAADDSGSMRPRAPTVPPPLPPEEAAKALAPRPSQAPVSASVRPSAAPAQQKSGPPVALILVFVVLLGGAIYGGLRLGGAIGGAPAGSAAANAPPSATIAAPSASTAAPTSSVPAPTRTISIPEVN